MQEVHGSQAEPSCQLYHRRLHSGLDEERIRCSELILGRAQVRSPSMKVDSLTARIAAETQVAAQCPEMVTVLVMGDFNFSVDAPMHLH
eukprot:4840563-Pyramimonas_sp.AAC.1